MNGFFATVDIYRRPGWNIFRNLIKGGCGIKMSWVENFLEINKSGGRDRGGRLVETREYGWFHQFCKFSSLCCGS